MKYRRKVYIEHLSLKLINLRDLKKKTNTKPITTEQKKKRKKKRVYIRGAYVECFAKCLNTSPIKSLIHIVEAYFGTV